MPVIVRQGGVNKTVTGMRVRVDGVVRIVTFGYVRQGGVIKQFFSTSAPPVELELSPPNVFAQLPVDSPPYVFNVAAVVNFGTGPYTYVWNAAGPTLISGQGTSTAQFQATTSISGSVSCTVTAAVGGSRVADCFVDIIFGIPS